MSNGNDPKIEQLERKLADAKAVAESATPVDGLVVTERSAVRTHTTKIIVWVYAIVLVSIILYLMWHGLQPTKTDSAISAILDLVKTALIPIVTFVIGHYFGSSQK